MRIRKEAQGGSIWGTGGRGGGGAPHRNEDGQIVNARSVVPIDPNTGIGMRTGPDGRFIEFSSPTPGGTTQLGNTVNVDSSSRRHVNGLREREMEYDHMDDGPEDVYQRIARLEQENIGLRDENNHFRGANTDLVTQVKALTAALQKYERG